MVCSALCEAESNLFTQMPPDLGHSLEELHPGPWNFLSPLGPAHVLLPGAGTGEGLALPPPQVAAGELLAHFWCWPGLGPHAPMLGPGTALQWGRGAPPGRGPDRLTGDLISHLRV